MPTRRKAPTMKDVARLAGVSVQTVSAVVNEKPEISAETRERVLRAIESLGYRPYSVARSLRTRRTRTIALLVTDIANPSLATIASAAEEYAHQFGYSLTFYNTHDDLRREEQYVRMATERWIDGVIFVSTADRMDSLDSLQAAGIPAVAIDRVPQGFDGPSITLDNRRAGQLAAEHLISLGHRRLAHISGPLDLRLARDRQEGFWQAVEARGLPRGPSATGSGRWDCQTGYEAMQKILEQGPHPTGLFAANDRMAIGAIRALKERGLSVPGDVSVVGLDDIEIAAFQNPPLTTIRQSFADMAVMAVQILLDILEGKGSQQRKIVIEPALIIRGSTAPCARD